LSNDRPNNDREDRHPVHWRVHLRCAEWGLVRRVLALNASAGGVFLVTSKPLPVGATVALTLELPDNKKITLSGVVRHVVTPEKALMAGHSPGVGVKIEPQHLLGLRKYLKLEAASPTSRETNSSVASTVLQSAPQPEPATPTLPRVSRPEGAIAPVVGIDFGTSYSSVSVAIGDRVRLIPDDQGRTTQPSVVSFLENGEAIVGWPARQMVAQNPSRVISSVKRLLGEKYSDLASSGYLQSTAYKTQPGVNDSVVVVIDEQPYRVAEICSRVINHIKQIAEGYLGQPVTQAVLSCPVSFSQESRNALLRVAELAKLKVIDIIEEPVAGALAYGIGGGKNEIIAVYDFGGGTFDFSILDINNNNIRVLNTAGDRWLGGDDFDEALAQSVADAFWRQTKIELRQRVIEWQRLLLACEAVKRELTKNTKAQLWVPDIIESQRLEIRQTVERSTFDELCQDLLERSLVASDNRFSPLTTTRIPH
jgi:Tfp pilus assembly protein PilZ